ncbi:MAG: diguanylate cyclase, partial [Oscillospiraceae bacterium]
MKLKLVVTFMGFDIAASIAALAILSILYWYLLFKLINKLLPKQYANTQYALLISIVNTAVVFFTCVFIRLPNFPFVMMFAIMLLEFRFVYKCTLYQDVFCALACIIHVLIANTLINGIFSFLPQFLSHVTPYNALWETLSLVVTFILLNLAIVLVIRFLPLGIVRIINEHSEPQGFLIAWISINCAYLLYNKAMFYRHHTNFNWTGGQIALAVTVMATLYIVLFFAIKIVALLGYKEKNTELTQAMMHEQEYRNSVTKDALLSYEVNLTQNKILHGTENPPPIPGGITDSYMDMIAYTSNKSVHSDDISVFMKYASPDMLLRKFAHGKSEATADYRILKKSGEYIWVRSITNLVKDTETEDVIAYVYIKDINKEKRRLLELQHMAERDCLTELYNRETTSKLVNENLSDEHEHVNSVLFMIDVDNFKAINDHLGHAFGDAVLCELADKLRNIFRKGDILGRIGGDEFIVYIKNDAHEKIAQEKAEEICKTFSITYKGANGENRAVSSSIGIALAPKDGCCFDDLYRHADAALYMAKNAGKSRYCFYDGSDFAGYESNRSEIYMQGETAQKNFRQNRIEYVFKILYQSENPVEAIHSVLELVANHFFFERGYIFETDKDERTTSNTFEWCANGIPSKKDNFQHIPIAMVSAENESFYKTGTYIVKNLASMSQKERTVLEPQGIKSMFQFGIFDKRHLLGFIGFDNCINEALPSSTEIEEIATICNILSTFFVKQRIDEIASRDLQVRQAIMNHLSNVVYVINPENFELLFMNDQTRKWVGDIDAHTPCYRFFRGESSQCKDCPIRDLETNHAHQASREIFNDKYKIWMDATVSTLHWTDGSLACLVEAADKTAQKEEHMCHIEQLEKLAFTDEVTGVRNFCKFEKDALEILENEQNISHFLVKLDIDNFKLINQLYGYEKGNYILRCVANAIEKTARNKNEIFARVSSDEFVALFSAEDIATIKKLYEDFIRNFNSTVDKDFAFKCIFPHGVYVINSDDMQNLDIKNLFEKVNIAHKEAKLNKSKKYIIYDECMTQKALCIKEVENKMSDALINHEFVVYLQPKYYLNTETIGGAEALSRWQSENKSLFMPSAFIPVFEKNGFITKLD